MLREPRETITWRPSNRDGTFGDLVEFEMRSVDVAELRGWWRAGANAQGRARAVALGEVRTLMDMFAVFAPVSVVAAC